MTAPTTDRPAATGKKTRGKLVAVPDEAPPRADLSGSVGSDLGLIELNLITPSADNPRGEVVSDESLAELGASILAQGLLQPIVVAPRACPEPVDGQVTVIGPVYDLVFGHRRYAAAALVGITSLPAILREDLTGARAGEARLVENLHREDLSAVDEAHGYAALMKAHTYTQADVAAAVGCGQGHVSKRLALLNLPAVLQAMIPDRLSIGDAGELAKVKDRKLLDALAARADGDPGYKIDRTKVATVQAAEAADLERAQVARAIGKRKQPVLAEGDTAGALQISTYGKLSHVPVKEHVAMPCCAWTLSRHPASLYGPNAGLTGMAALQARWAQPWCTTPAAHPDPREVERAVLAAAYAEQAAAAALLAAERVEAAANDPVAQAALRAELDAEADALAAQAAAADAERVAVQAARDAAAELAAARERDTDARRAFMTALVRGRPAIGGAAHVNRYTLTALSLFGYTPECVYDEAALAATAGVDLRQVLLSGAADDVARVALAVVLLEGDKLVVPADKRWNGSGGDSEDRVLLGLHAAFLVGAGYEPTERETEMFAHNMTLAHFDLDPADADDEPDDEPDERPVVDVLPDLAQYDQAGDVDTPAPDIEVVEQ